MSLFLSIALLNRTFDEGSRSVIHFPLFTSTEILDICEMSNFVIREWIEHHRFPDLNHLTLQCGINLLRIAAFFQFEYVLKALEKFIEKRVTYENLIEIYRIAQVSFCDYLVIAFTGIACFYTCGISHDFF